MQIWKQSHKDSTSNFQFIGSSKTRLVRLWEDNEPNPELGNLIRQKTQLFQQMDFYKVCVGEGVMVHKDLSIKYFKVLIC